MLLNTVRDFASFGLAGSQVVFTQTIRSSEFLVETDASCLVPYSAGDEEVTIPGSIISIPSGRFGFRRSVWSVGLPVDCRASMLDELAVALGNFSL